MFNNFNFFLNFFLNARFIKIIYIKLSWFLKIFRKKIQEYPRNISPKAITKVIKKQMGVAHIISFAPK
jgi:hypothetical protein